MEKTIEISGTPYFIKETETGTYCVLNKIILPEKFDNPYMWEHDGKIGELFIGMDIQELPCRGLSIIVRYEMGEHIIESAIIELKKLGRLTLSDYVSYEPLGNLIGRNISSEGKIAVSEVRPRLFRKY